MPNGNTSQSKDSAQSSSHGTLKVGYMQHAVVQYYYAELNKDSLEHAVDVLWANILPLYFTLTKGYGIEQQQRPWPGATKTKADFVIRYIKNGQPKKVCLIEDKRVKLESSDTTWAEAVHQVTGYMTATRASNPNPKEVMYGIVTVGHYSRFYELLPGKSQLRDYRSHDGSPLHFKHDEPKIDAILCELVTLTQSSSGYSEAESSSSAHPQAPNWVWDADAQKHKYWDGAQWVWQQ